MSQRVGVIGAGVMGADHALTLHRSVRGATVTRVADLDLERAAAVTDQIAGAEPTTDPRALAEHFRGYGGTILRTTNRGNPFFYPRKQADGTYQEEDRSDELMENASRLGIDALISIGGDGSLDIARRLCNKGMRIVCVPKTIDHDVSGTVTTFGFDTAVNTAIEAIDKLHTTAESHDRVMIMEVMGRDAGFIALHSGVAGTADVILIPEIPYDIASVAERGPGDANDADDVHVEHAVPLVVVVVRHGALSCHLIQHGIGRLLQVVQQVCRLAHGPQVHDGRLAWHQDQVSCPSGIQGGAFTVRGGIQHHHLRPVQGADPLDQSQAQLPAALHELGDGASAGLAHPLRAIHFDCARADAEIHGDHFVGHPRYHA